MPEIGCVTVDEGEWRGLGLYLTYDPDGDSVTVSASAENMPRGAVFDIESLTFSWTPDYDQAGTYYDIKFTATDEHGAVSEIYVDITVIDIIQPDTTKPIILITSPQDNSAILDIRVLVEGVVYEENLDVVDVKVEGYSWMPADLTEESAGKYTFSCSLDIPEGEMTTIVARAKDTSNNTSSCSISVIKGYMRIVSCGSGGSSIETAKSILELIRLGSDFPSDAAIFKYALPSPDHSENLYDNRFLSHLDPQGMKAVLEHFNNNPDTYGFKLIEESNFDSFLHWIVALIDCPILANNNWYDNWPPQGVNPDNPPFAHEPNVPVAVPLKANVNGYSQWVIVNGFIADKSPYEGVTQPWYNWGDFNTDIKIYGLFLDGTYVPYSELRNYIKPMPTMPIEGKYGYIEKIQCGYGTTINLYNYTDKYADKYIAVADPPKGGSE
jgi:hypothetical protein